MMTDNYEIVFEIEKRCEKELRKKRVNIDAYINKMMQYAVTFYENGTEPHIIKLDMNIQKRLYFNTTLYIVRLGLSERALVTIDEDKLFDKLIITLWAFTENHDYEKIFRRLGESMYQKYLNQEDNTNE
jgi:hypothetical protein